VKEGLKKKNMKYQLICALLFLLPCTTTQAQNVGIGTVTPQFRADIADTSTTTLLRLRNITDVVGSRTLLRLATTTSTSVSNFNSSFIGNYLPSGGGSAFIVGTASPNLSPAERMRLNENGNLGIATTDPQARLHLDLTGTTNADAMIIDDDGDPVFRFRRDGSERSYFQLLGEDFKVATTTNNETGRLILRTNGTDRVFVMPNGNTGIGADAPAARLHVEGDIIAEDATPALLFRATGSPSTIAFMQIVGNNMLFGSGISTSMPLRFYTAGEERAVITQNGLLGFGTTSPITDFHLDFGSSLNFEPIIVNFSGGTRQIQFRRQNVAFGMMEFAQDVMSLGTVSTDHLVFRTNSSERMRVDQNGRIAMNTISVPAGYRLAVNGNIICTDITTLPFGSWPDYVFGDNHKRPTLEELQEYIRQHRHLPGLPSATTIEKEGIKLGEMQRLQMEKIEELTLYILELKKEIDALKNHH
jgi:hypothetical protein